MALKKLSENGSEIIFITSRTEKYLEYFKKYLNEIGIKYKSIISGCNHNKRIIVNDFSSTNPYPSCLSINIPRNGNLNDYL
jgi:excinuclease UvrABC helicase subunit UvrB